MRVNVELQGPAEVPQVSTHFTLGWSHLGGHTWLVALGRLHLGGCQGKVNRLAHSGGKVLFLKNSIIIDIN